MSDDNKPKIDLKARLGKKTVAGVGPSIPPPVVGGPGSLPPGAMPGPGPGPQAGFPGAGIPGSPSRPPVAGPSGFPGPAVAPAAARPQAPAPNMGGPRPPMGGPTSIPAPPFGPTPSLTPSPNFGAPPPGLGNPGPAPQASMRPREIKIEMGEEVLQAQKKQGSRYKILAIGAAIVGMILGVVFGDGMARRRSQNIALEGSKLLAEEVDKANGEIEKLADTLKTYLVGKGIGLMPADVNRLLVKFAGDAERANDQKDRLQRVLNGMREPVKELLSEKDAPKVRWGISVGRGSQGPLASMIPLPKPFLVTSKENGYKWPADFEVQQGNKKVKLERYEKGDPVAETPPLIPVDPGTQSLVCPSDTLIRLSRELGELETTLRGDKSDPTDERAGLVDTGNALREKLKTVGQ
jgi:hypothetical protein